MSRGVGARDQNQKGWAGSFLFWFLNHYKGADALSRKVVQRVTGTEEPLLCNPRMDFQVLPRPRRPTAPTAHGTLDWGSLSLALGHPRTTLFELWTLFVAPVMSILGSAMGAPRETLRRKTTRQVKQCQEEIWASLIW